MAVLTSRVRISRPINVAGFVLSLTGSIFLLYFAGIFFVTLITGVILALLLEPFVLLLGRVRIPRGPASFLVCAVALLMLYLAGLGLYTQVAALVEDLPRYQARINYLVETVLDRVDAMERGAYQLVVPSRFRNEPPPQPAPQPPAPVKTQRKRNVEPPKPMEPLPFQVPEVRIRPERPPMVRYLAAHLGSLYQVALMASFVPFLVYFMLSWQDHLRRSFLQLFQEPARQVASLSLERIGRIVRAFVVGNFILGLLLMGASSLVFWLFNLPYPILIGSLSGFLSLIPYIGLPLAMLPPVVAALAVHTAMAPYLLVGGIVALLHLIALNLLYPKIVGPRVHLNPLAVTVALMAWSALWGAAGLVLAIPITAGVKAVCDNVDRLRPYGKLLGD